MANRNLRIPPPPEIISPEAGFSTRRFCIERYSSSESNSVTNFVNTLVSINSIYLYYIRHWRIIQCFYMLVETSGFSFFWGEQGKRKKSYAKEFFVSPNYLLGLL